MCTGKGSKSSVMSRTGFTALEVMIAVVLTVLLALGVGPLVTSVEETGGREGDRTVGVIQGRVAAARLERDLRMASSEGSPFEVEGPVLQADPRQVVFLGRRQGDGDPYLIEWEIVGDRLMRRWGACPPDRPELFPHRLYSDHKTMLQGLAAGAEFTFVVDGGPLASSIPERDLYRIDAVGLTADGSDSCGRWEKLIVSRGRVGR